MNTPVPSPRSLEGDLKKPVPTPRQSVRRAETAKLEETCSGSSTFSRRIRLLSNASKQIAEDIGELVHDKKKAVIEGTRQSVRRITKHFNPNNQPEHDFEIKTNHAETFDDSIDIFHSISFQSPVSICNNADEPYGFPPPSHTPPPLPDDSFYDIPPSLAGSSSNSENSHALKNVNYESVFPSNTNYSSSDISQSGSWKLYDTVPAAENMYENDGYTKTSNIENVSSIIGDFSIDIRNSFYENHEINIQNESDKEKVRESVILQFDPLRSEQNVSDMQLKIGDDLHMLEQRLEDDLYGISSIDNLDEWSISNESELEEFVTPPAPPIRYDSLPEEEHVQPSIANVPKHRSKTNWFTHGENQKQNLTESKKMGWLKQVLDKTPQNIKAHKNKDIVVQRPELEVKSVVQKKGMLYKVQNGPVEDLFGEYSGRWCVLQNSNLTCFADNTCETIKEHFPSESILSVQILQDPKFKYRYDNSDLHCFELNTTGKARGGHIYGARDISERRIWMQLIAECLTRKFSNRLTTDYTRMGWTYLREGVSGKWVGAWILLSNRTLYYALDGQALKSMDLRRARCVVLQNYQETDNYPRTNDKGPNMVVDSPDLTLYLRMWTSRETKVWCHIVKLTAHNNGAHLNQQQLTKNDIPVVVEKCINFIYVHGSMSEGIYRRPGAGAAVSEILVKFRKDAWAVQLTRDKYTEHDVATALKRFFRDLPEPLLLSNMRQYLHEVSIRKNLDDKVRMYKAALDQLPNISYKTARKLLGHLHFIASQSDRNLMTIDNLASLWGPTLMFSDDKESEFCLDNNRHQQDITVIKQLLELFKYIFPEDTVELQQEKIMLQVLKKITNSPQGIVNSNRKAGDFRVWVYLMNKEGQTVNIAVGPNRTCYDVCLELSFKMGLPVDELILEEVVLNEQLVRPLHHSEKVLNIILGWSYWDELDRKDNHLIITPIKKYSEFIQENVGPQSGELKFADSKSKNFKLYMFEFSQATLKCFKDRTCTTNLYTWNVEDMIWYLGNESKRNPQSRWTITFYEVKNYPKRTKASPYFGYILAWSSPQSRANWVAALLKARYKETLIPPPMHVNLMS